MKIILNKQLILESEVEADNESHLGFGAGVLGTLGGLAAGAAILKRKSIKSGIRSGIDKVRNGVNNKVNDVKETMAAKLDPEAAKAKADSKKDSDFEAAKKEQEQKNNETIEKERADEVKQFSKNAKDRSLREAKARAEEAQNPKPSQPKYSM